MTVLRLATRASELALAQARQVARQLEAALGVGTELLPVKTRGDRLRGVSLAGLGGKGLFVKEIEEALLEGRAELAVHSAKDLPAELPEELELVAFPERADARDALVFAGGPATLEALPRGARVGTGSLRRAAQLHLRRPDLRVEGLRGNVPTRLRRLAERGLDALVLACAGLERLGLAAHIGQRLAPELMLPAVAQGALAVQGRRGDPAARDAAAVDHGPSALRVAAERAVLAGLHADCTVPLAALAEHRGRSLHLRALLLSRDGRRAVGAELEGAPETAAELGARAARRLLEQGGDALLAELRAETDR